MGRFFGLGNFVNVRHRTNTVLGYKKLTIKTKRALSDTTRLDTPTTHFYKLFIIKGVVSNFPNKKLSRLYNLDN